MPRDLTAYLLDILKAGKAIVTFTESMLYDDYLASDLIQSAVERKFTIIGEAINLLLREHSELTGRLHDAKDIVAFRNRVIHGYFSVDEAIIWSAVRSSLPALLSDVQELLDEQP